MISDVQNLATESLRQIAPDIDINDVDKQQDLRDEFDIDSMDFINLVTRLGQELKIDIPETDYPDMVVSFNALVDYLNNHTPVS